MTLIAVTPPAAEPVTLEEAKLHLRVDDDDDDMLVSTLIAAARQHVDGPEGRLGRALVEQVWDMKLDAFPEAIEVPLPPCQSIDSISYVDPAGTPQALGAEVYQVTGLGDVGHPAIIREAFGKSWPATRHQGEAVTIRFTAGYEVAATSPPDYAANVPEPIRQAIKLLVGHWYENREAAVVGIAAAPLPMAVDALLAPYRVKWL